MKKSDTYKIYKSVTPSERPIVVDVKDIIVVTMSCGGGMGGSKWKEYFDAVGIESIPSEQMVTFTDAVTGKKERINTKFIVKVEEKQMLKVYQDITKWKNYDKVVCKKCYRESYIALDRDTKWECAETYGNNDNETFKTDTYEE